MLNDHDAAALLEILPAKQSSRGSNNNYIPLPPAKKKL